MWARFAGVAAEGKDGAGKGPVKVPPVNVHIGSIAINVQSNQDPGRIAELVEFRLKHAAVYPKSSAHVADYGRGGG